MAQDPQKTNVTALRLSVEHRAKLDAVVNALNDRAYEQGLAPVYTVANVLQTRIVEWLESEEVARLLAPRVKTLDREIKPASNVLAAFERLRGAGK